MTAFTAVAFAAWLLYSLPTSRATAPGTFRSALKDPVTYAKNKLTAGIGIAFEPQSTLGPPVIQMVMIDSPADNASLRSGDTIIRVQGIMATGMVQVAEMIRGLRGGTVALTVQRRVQQTSTVSFAAAPGKDYEPPSLGKNESFPAIAYEIAHVLDGPKVLLMSQL